MKKQQDNQINRKHAQKTCSTNQWEMECGVSYGITHVIHHSMGMKWDHWANILVYWTKTTSATTTKESTRKGKS